MPGLLDKGLDLGHLVQLSATAGLDLSAQRHRCSEEQQPQRDGKAHDQG